MHIYVCDSRIPNSEFSKPKYIWVSNILVAVELLNENRAHGLWFRLENRSNGLFVTSVCILDLLLLTQIFLSCFDHLYCYIKLDCFFLFDFESISQTLKTKCRANGDESVQSKVATIINILINIWASFDSRKILKGMQFCRVNKSL